MTTASLAVRTERLTKVFGSTRSVDELTLDVPLGAVFGFIGPSGCGKTTTVRLLAGLYRPTSGTASVLGRAPSSFTRADRERIGYMPQQVVLYREMSIVANVDFAARIYGVNHERRARVERVLDFVELGDHGGRRLAVASGGMQRRVALAATLVHDPELLFLDEPTAGLDPLLRIKLWDHFRQLRDEGRTLFVTTQHLDEATRCDVVGLMVAGRLVELDTPGELRRRAMGGDVLRVRTNELLDARCLDSLRKLPGVRRLEAEGSTPTTVDIVVDDARAAMTPVVALLDGSVGVASIEPHLPPFDDVFVRLVHGGVRDLTGPDDEA